MANGISGLGYFDEGVRQMTMSDQKSPQAPPFRAGDKSFKVNIHTGPMC